MKQRYVRGAWLSQGIRCLHVQHVAAHYTEPNESAYI